MIYIQKSLIRILVCLAFTSGLLFGFAMAHGKPGKAIDAYFQGRGANPNNSGAAQ